MLRASTSPRCSLIAQDGLLPPPALPGLFCLVLMPSIGTSCSQGVVLLFKEKQAPSGTKVCAATAGVGS